MRTLLSCFLITLLSFGLIINEASAKRFGGGRSFGVQRSHSSLFSSNKTYNQSSLAQKANKNRWGGVLGGLLVGGLLASLFMGNGLANGLITWLILGAVIFFIISFLRRRMNPGFQSAQSGTFRQNSFQQFTQNYENRNSGGAHFAQQETSFDAENFLRDAKVTFIRLQAAYDQKNLQDLQAFTVPEVFAEIKMQLDERGEAPNQTEVISLDAKLLDVSKQSLSTIASVQFTGTIKENSELSNLDEIWHFRQFDNRGEWVVGGIQQEVFQP
ncbi:TPA: Tim44 domain-containing protein [Legionella pneumophila]|uniref:Tim44 domain-containing protein n=1 Tax=Legionella pneumophila TaxID=446 RepID=UPI000787C392|nr:Tim44-like domain-containing protein [Legionella pneumophila]HAU1191143.1 Tim44 domain-containing protein [Legionella pneumophila]HBD7102592.1 Tim44 domain-containing protein [Legionella pneumophila]HCO4739094.1 Tim44 domain-containing protein [Legionella pneumophila]HDU7929219.1 Tim44 domain-containing protein [Legionella pneumophila]HDU7935960.1 Tim44 domain-containing protein [Legionella pneumophila]